MKATAGVLFVGGVLGFLIFLVISLFVNYQLDNEIDGWKDRAQVSSEPNDMLEWMTHVQVGMEKWGMTRGHAALIWKTPENDMSLIYLTVTRHVDQARVLTEMNRSSPEYQTGLDNLRGSIRELELHSWDYWSRHDGLIVMVFLIGSILAAIVGGFILTV